MRVTSNIALTVSALAGLALLGCQGGGDSEVLRQNALCHAVAVEGSTVTATPAANATFDHPDNIFDGDLSSFAVLNTQAGAGSSTIRGTLPSGATQSGDLAAGFFVHEQIISNTNITVTTYLNGIQQDTGAAVTNTSDSSGSFNGINTTKPFDAIEVTFNFDPTNPSSSQNLYELCVRPGIH